VCECGKKVATKVAKKLVAREESKAKKKIKVEWNFHSLLPVQAIEGFFASNECRGFWRMQLERNRIS